MGRREPKIQPLSDKSISDLDSPQFSSFGHGSKRYAVCKTQDLDILLVTDHTYLITTSTMTKDAVCKN